MLRPRWLGLLALMIVLVIAFIIAGLWQMDVARAKGSSSTMHVSQNAAPRPLTGVLKPHQPFPNGGSLMPVTVRGHYDPAHQLLVSGRVLHGHSGYWVITPVVVRATGARVAVVRGFVRTPSQAGPPATGNRPVTVTGALAPGEAPSTATGAIPNTVDLSEMLNRWGGSVYNAFVFMTHEQPVATTGGVQTFPPPKPATQGLRLLNAGYALQWWAFAVFAVFLYLRMLREAHEAELVPAADETAGLPDPDPQGDNDSARTTHTKDAHA